MRILLTVHQFFPEGKGGTEVLTLHTAQELQRRGHEVTILAGHATTATLRDEERFDWHEYGGLRVRRFLHQHVPMGDQSNTVEMEYNNRLLGRELTRLLRESPQDVVHFFHLSRLTMAAVDAAMGEAGGGGEGAGSWTGDAVYADGFLADLPNESTAASGWRFVQGTGAVCGELCAAFDCVVAAAGDCGSSAVAAGDGGGGRGCSDS